MQGWTANGNQETWRDRNVLCFDRVGGVLEIIQLCMPQMDAVFTVQKLYTSS